MPSKKSHANRAIGKAIREIRTTEKTTQEEFAYKAGIDRSYFGAIERGEFNVTVDTLMSVAKGLGVRASELLRRAGL